MTRSSSNNKFLADLMAIIHGLWILIVLVSLPLVLWQPSARWFTMVVVVTNVSAWIIWRDCPLHLWENNFRRQYDPGAVYHEAFISHYLQKIFHLQVSTVTVRVLVYSYAVLSVVVAWLAR